MVTLSREQEAVVAQIAADLELSQDQVVEALLSQPLLALLSR